MIPLEKAITDLKVPYGRMSISGEWNESNLYFQLAVKFKVSGMETLKIGNTLHVWDSRGDCDFDLDLQTLGAILSAGGYFKGIRTGFFVPENLFEELTPEGLHNSQIEHESETEQKDFEEWANSYDTRETTLNGQNGLLFRVTKEDGSFMDSNDLAPLFNYMQYGFGILFWKEFSELWKSLEPETPEL